MAVASDSIFTEPLVAISMFRYQWTGGRARKGIPVVCVIRLGKVHAQLRTQLTQVLHYITFDICTQKNHTMMERPVCSLHSAENTREFSGLALTKLTIFNVVSKTSFKLSGIPLAARASRWMLQCTQVASGATACTPVTTSMSSCHGFCSLSTDTKTSCPPKSVCCPTAVQYLKNILSCCPGFQKRMSSLIEPP